MTVESTEPNAADARAKAAEATPRSPTPSRVPGRRDEVDVGLGLHAEGLAARRDQGHGLHVPAVADGDAGQPRERQQQERREKGEG